ncbi:putative glutathione S-transferase kappa 1 [Mycena metata]|uniref:Glutathione S-transferase kappa n=1 Tax=Mycena metata TaxID=1033252 RepID=A0AAD7J9R6_9AGAR|nr:putative glutathione S-transferase kappa 1 [Mycena metata]
MAGHIDCYMDTSSFYSFLCLVFLLKHQKLLASHDVSVEFIPVFLGGINVGSGNKPPWTLPAKAAYGEFEMKRAMAYHNVPGIERPSFFPVLTVLPQRALCYIKDTFPRSTFEQAWIAFFRASWIPRQLDLSKPDVLETMLRESKLFSAQEVDAICAAAKTQEWKDRLTANTKTALDLGAFGAPWLMVRNAEGKVEPFFGSDRFYFIWEYLGLPWKDFELLPRRAKL